MSFASLIISLTLDPTSSFSTYIINWNQQLLKLSQFPYPNYNVSARIEVIPTLNSLVFFFLAVQVFDKKNTQIYINLYFFEWNKFFKVFESIFFLIFYIEKLFLNKDTCKFFHSFEEIHRFLIWMFYASTQRMRVNLNNYMFGPYKTWDAVKLHMVECWKLLSLSLACSCKPLFVCTENHLHFNAKIT